MGLFFAEEGNRIRSQFQKKNIKMGFKRSNELSRKRKRIFSIILDNNPAIKEQISAPIFENKVFDHIVKLNKKSEKVVSFEQFKKKFDTQNAIIIIQLNLERSGR